MRILDESCHSTAVYPFQRVRAEFTDDRTPGVGPSDPDADRFEIRARPPQLGLLLRRDDLCAGIRLPARSSNTARFTAGE